MHTVKMQLRAYECVHGTYLGIRSYIHGRLRRRRVAAEDHINRFENLLRYAKTACVALNAHQMGRVARRNSRVQTMNERKRWIFPR